MTDTTTAGPAAAVTTVDTYLAMWNEEDPGVPGGARRRGLGFGRQLRRPVARSPRPPGAGRDGGRRAPPPVPRPPLQPPERRGRPPRRVALRLAAHCAPDGSVTVAGIDVGRTDADGRLPTRITGFFGDLPAHDPA